MALRGPSAVRQPRRLRNSLCSNSAHRKLRGRLHCSATPKAAGILIGVFENVKEARSEESASFYFLPSLSILLDILILFGKTLILRPYVFVFLAVSLFVAKRLLGWKRTGVFFGVTWLTAFVSELTSTRIGIPFGPYFYNESTRGQELYIFNIPFMDSVSFTFLLFASYCLALLFALPMIKASEGAKATLSYPGVLSWKILLLASFFFMYIDIVIDPIALRGDRWFLGLIYGYPNSGTYFGIPLENFAGWFVVGFVSLSLYRWVEQIGYFSSLTLSTAGTNILLGCGLYYVVLIFNLAMTFWIQEWLLAMVGCFLYLPVTILLLFRIPFWWPATKNVSQAPSG